MATIPIYGRFIGDFTAHLVAVDTEDTLAEVATKIAHHVVGRRLPPRPDAKGLEVLVGGCALDSALRVKDVATQPLQCLDVRWTW